MVARARDLDVLQHPVLVLLVLVVVRAHLRSVTVARSTDVQTFSGHVHNLVTLRSPLGTRVSRGVLGFQAVPLSGIVKHHVVKRRPDESLRIEIPQLVLGRWTLLVVRQNLGTSRSVRSFDVQHLSVQLTDDVKLSPSHSRLGVSATTLRILRVATAAFTVMMMVMMSFHFDLPFL